MENQINESNKEVENISEVENQVEETVKEEKTEEKEAQNKPDPRIYELDDNNRLELEMYQGYSIILKKSNRTFDYVGTDEGNLSGMVYIVELTESGRVVDPHRNFNIRPTKEEVDQAIKDVKEEFEREQNNKPFWKFW